MNDQDKEEKSKYLSVTKWKFVECSLDTYVYWQIILVSFEVYFVQMLFLS